MATTMALFFPSNCYFNKETLHLENPNFRISPKSSFNLKHHHPHLYSFPGKHEHQLRNKCFRVRNEFDEDSLRDKSQDDEEHDVGVKAALSILGFYKREISPLLPKSCRYVPSCSEYSMIAYKKYGVAKGTILTAWRICRCNPLGGSGFDPPRWFDEPRPSED